jgi:putative addiction module killer protein
MPTVNARACHGHPQLGDKEDVDTRDKPARDAEAATAIVARFRRMEQRNSGDTRSIGKGIMKCVSSTDLVSASTIWITERRLILLCGGDKSAQRQDIKWAQIDSGDILIRKISRFDAAPSRPAGSLEQSWRPRCGARSRTPSIVPAGQMLIE